ncbi:MAG: EamA family transporter [Thermoplasmatota archaeon]
MVRKVEPWLIFAVLSLLLYGLWGFFPKLATDSGVEPRSILVYETIGTAAIALIVLAVIGFKPQFTGRGFSFALIAGTAGALGSLFFLLALSKGKASVVVTMTALYPLIVIILSYFVLKEPLTLKQGIGIVFALVAMILFSI